MDYVINFVKENIPEVKVRKPEGTYLMWLDFSALGMTKEELSMFMQKMQKLLLMMVSGLEKMEQDLKE